jgi:hypothetical protein
MQHANLLRPVLPDSGALARSTRAAASSAGNSEKEINGRISREAGAAATCIWLPGISCGWSQPINNHTVGRLRAVEHAEQDITQAPTRSFQELAQFFRDVQQEDR